MKLKISVAFIFVAFFSGIQINAQRSKVLPVPYKVQPTSYTCQSTCLKMMGIYEGFPLIDSKEIKSIYKEVNESPTRPDKVHKNSWKNITWWLNDNVNSSQYSLAKTNDEVEAIEYLVKKIDAGHPVILSTNNTRTSGHIVLIVGYENYVAGQSTEDMKFICHDPYGEFFPELHSTYYGQERYRFGSSLPDGSENGVGKGVKISPNNLKRYRDDSHHSGYYVMISK